jgi:hypothetical protein
MKLPKKRLLKSQPYSYSHRLSVSPKPHPKEESNLSDDDKFFPESSQRGIRSRREKKWDFVSRMEKERLV